MQGAQSHKSEITASVSDIQRQDFSTAEKLELLDRILSQWIGAVSAAEFAVIMFIYRRTVAWGKKKELIVRRHFLEGIFKNDTGECIQAPLTIKQTTLKLTLGSLEKRGIIFRERRPGDLSWFQLNTEWSPQMLKQPKPKVKERDGLKQPKRGGTKSVREGDEIRPQKNSHKQTTHLKNQAADASYSAGYKTDGVKETDEPDLKTSMRTASENAKALRQKKTEQRKRRESVADLEKLWNDFVKKNFPDVPYAAWTKVQAGKVSKFRNKYKEEQGNKAVWPFLEFSVANWDRIGKLRFGWMKDIQFPEFPDIEFLMGFKKHFLIAYSDERFHERQMNATGYEREIAKLKRMGYTDEQAKEVVEQSEKRQAVLQKEADRAARAESDAGYQRREKERLERELRREKVQREKDRERLERELNRGSEKEKPKPKKKHKYDADGYIIGELEGLE